MPFIDTHCHLFLKEFEADAELVIEKSVKAGVTKMVVPNVDSTSILPLLELCNNFKKELYPSIGIHPCSVKENFKEELLIHEKCLESNDFVAIGEIGIDLYWDKTFVKEQIAALEIQLQWALEHNLPAILHCRESFDEVYNIVKNYKNLRGVFHAFSGSCEQALKVIDIGFYIGIGGVVTFKNSNLGNGISSLSMENIILETDAPYLTPAPYRGKRNDPSYIPIIAEKLANIFNYSIKEIEEITTRNALKLFNKII